MKERKLTILLALLAALALVFAAGCDSNGADGGDDGSGTEQGGETGGNGNTGGNTCSCTTTGCTGGSTCSACTGQSCCEDCGTEAEGQSTVINMTYIGSFLGSINGHIGGNSGSDDTAYWTFVGGTLTGTSYAMAGVGGDSYSTDVSAGGVITSLAGLGTDSVVTSSDELLQVSFANLSWETPAPGNDNSTLATGSIVVKVELVSGADSSSYTISTTGDDSALTDFSSSGLNVTLVFTKENVTSGSWTD